MSTKGHKQTKMREKAARVIKERRQKELSKQGGSISNTIDYFGERAKSIKNQQKSVDHHEIKPEPAPEPKTIPRLGTVDADRMQDLVNNVLSTRRGERFIKILNDSLITLEFNDRLWEDPFWFDKETGVLNLDPDYDDEYWDGELTTLLKAHIQDARITDDNPELHPFLLWKKVDRPFEKRDVVTPAQENKGDVAIPRLGTVQPERAQKIVNSIHSQKWDFVKTADTKKLEELNSTDFRIEFYLSTLTVGTYYDKNENAFYMDPENIEKDIARYLVQNLEEIYNHNFEFGVPKEKKKNISGKFKYNPQ